MQGFGALLIIWGIFDYIMGESGTDVYYDWFGIYLPDSIYSYSHWISMVIGTFFIGAGRASNSSNSSGSSTPQAASDTSGSSTTNSALAGGAAGAVTGMTAAQMAALKRAQESAQQYEEEQKAEADLDHDSGDVEF